MIQVTGQNIDNYNKISFNTVSNASEVSNINNVEVSKSTDDYTTLIGGVVGGESISKDIKIPNENIRIIDLNSKVQVEGNTFKVNGSTVESALTEESKYLYTFAQSLVYTAAGDEEAMARAHDNAETVRAKYGFSGGENGDEYNTIN